MCSKYFLLSIHLAVWVLFFALTSIAFYNVPDTTDLPHNFFWISNLYHIALFYLNAYWLFPEFFNWKRWWIYVPCIIFIIVFSYHAKLYLLNVFSPSFRLTSINRRILFFPPIPFLIASFIFSAIRKKIRLERMEKERKAEHLTAELKFLRSQVSPHFLFSMMTNMVALARKKSDLLEPSLIKLSDMLRYMLYETEEEKSTVSKEIEYLENYIELQQLRFGDSVRIETEIEDEHNNCTIEPMLLIPFVENAFKHGIGLATDPFISIVLKVKNNLLEFKVTNNYTGRSQSKDKSSGIGLINVKNRLNLLYPGRYKLSVKDNGEVYIIHLNLELLC